METQTYTGEPVKKKNGFIPKNSEPPEDNTFVPLEDLPSVRLSPRQGEEIHSDEYSLKLFYATRICPMTFDEIIQRFPEPTPGKAQSVLDKYIDCDLIYKTPEGAYYSNYPDNYINYSDHKYDEFIETQKDAKIFETMKNYSGRKEYWKTRSFFSIDSFFTPEQTQELQDMFTDIRYKAKQFVDKNAKNKTLDGLKFRRLKFYDMVLSVLFFVLVGTMPVKNVFAGNDPTQPGFSNSIHFNSSGNHNHFVNKQMGLADETSPHSFDVALFESMRDDLEMKGSGTGEPIIMTLIQECREYLLPGGSGPHTWNLDCVDMAIQWAMYECMNENERACSELKSEDLILEI